QQFGFKIGIELGEAPHMDSSMCTRFKRRSRQINVSESDFVASHLNRRLLLAPAAAISAIEHMETDLGHLLHGGRPERADIGRVIMGGGTNLRQPDLTGGDCFGDLLRHAPLWHFSYAMLLPIAGKRKLACIEPVAILIDHIANGSRIRRVANAIEYDLRYGYLSFDGF